MTIYQVVKANDDYTAYEVLFVSKYRDEAELMFDRWSEQLPHAYIDIHSY